MSDVVTSDADIAKLTRLGAILIPATDTMPGADQVAGFDILLRTAVKACGYEDETVRAALDAIPSDVDWNGAKAFVAAQPEYFEALSVLVSAAYYMARDVLDRLKFPVDRRHPAGTEDFVEEYSTGILDAVTERGPRYRDAGKPG